jgi:hypothetical protein
MRWLRSNGRCCGYLSLATLALQIILSFGHVHLGAVRASSVTTMAGTAMPAPHSLPTQPGDHGIGYCAICATIYLAANSFVPSVPQLAPPIARQRIEHSDRPAFVFVALWPTPFQSRAPPFA